MSDHPDVAVCSLCGVKRGIAVWLGFEAVCHWCRASAPRPRRVVGIALVLLLCSVSVSAQEATPFQWETNRAVPQWVSNIGVGANLGLDAWDSWRAPDRHERVRWACRTGLTVGIAEVTKALVHRTRPNGMDRKSFFSEHTALATTAAGYQVPVGASIAMTVAWGRQAGGFHYGSDVAVGATAGIFSRWVCR